MKKFSWLWIPRGVMIFFIAFLFLFSFDVFSTNEPIIQQIGAFFIHSIPSWVLIIVLIAMWKKPFITGIILEILAVFSIFFFHTLEHLAGFLAVTLPLILIGFSYIIYDKMIKDSEEDK